MANSLAILFSTEEAAFYLGVSPERILYWARDGLLRVTAQSESGDLLFRKHVLDAQGKQLAARAPVRLSKSLLTSPKSALGPPRHRVVPSVQT